MAVKPHPNILDLYKNELRSAVLHLLAADPGSPVEGLFYWHTGTKKLRVHNGSTFVDIGAGSGDVVGPGSAVDGQAVLFDSTTGKLVKASTLNGIMKSTSGVLSAASAGTDYTTPSSTESFTNKTFNANGTGNTISNLETADFASGVINQDTGLAGATNSQIPTAAAVKAYADSILAANDAMLFKGGIDCSTNPNYPAANAGDTYKVTVAGKIGGASGIDVAIGDTAYCTADSTASGNEATVGTYWTIVQANVDAATTTTQGLVELATQAEAEARSDTARAVTPASLVTFPRKYSVNIGNGSLTDFPITHGLGTTALTVEVFKVSSGQTWSVDVVRDSSSQVTIGFTGYTPSSNEFTVVCIG